MGHREDLVRQRKEQEAAEVARKDQEYKVEQEQRRQTLLVELSQLIAEVHREADRVIKLFESADWSMAEIQAWSVSVSMPARFWQRRPRFKQRDVMLAYFFLPDSMGQVVIRSDNTLHVEVRYEGWKTLNSFIGEGYDQRERKIAWLEHYRNNAKHALSILKQCTKQTIWLFI